MKTKKREDRTAINGTVANNLIKAKNRSDTLQFSDAFKLNLKYFDKSLYIFNSGVAPGDSSLIKSPLPITHN